MNFEVRVLLYQTSIRKIVCLDRGQELKRVPDKFVVLKNGVIGAVFSEGPPVRVYLTCEGVFECGEVLRNFITNDAEMEVFNFGKSVVIEPKSFRTIKDINETVRCPRCAERRFNVIQLTEQTLSIDEETTINQQTDLLITHFSCKACGYVIVSADPMKQTEALLQTAKEARETRK